MKTGKNCSVDTFSSLFFTGKNCVNQMDPNWTNGRKTHFFVSMVLFLFFVSGISLATSPHTSFLCIYRVKNINRNTRAVELINRQTLSNCHTHYASLGKLCLSFYSVYFVKGKKSCVRFWFSLYLKIHSHAHLFNLKESYLISLERRLQILASFVL